jgi:glycosyltransferase involved in cell wall biosynthesis
MSDPAPLYDWADVVVVPSRRPESLGRVAIEAMAHGRPPLASAIGGLEEVVEHGVSGWLVPPNDAPALARAIGDILLAPTAWSGFPAAARARFEAVFDPRAIASELTAILAGRLAAGSSARRTTGLAPV